MTTKWKSRRKNKTETLKELVFKVLSQFPSGVQYYDLVTLVNEETRHNYSRNGISQKFGKQKKSGVIILEPIKGSGSSYFWKLSEGCTWEQFNKP